MLKGGCFCGAIVGQLDPPELTARARMILRRQPFGIIKAACRDVDLVRGIVVLER